MMTDWELVEAFAERGEERAFGELVRRHVDLVFGAARRMLGRQGMHAEDVTQAVFLLLGLKAGGISRRVVLGAWLHRATVFCCRDVLKREGRRGRLEGEVAMER